MSFGRTANAQRALHRTMVLVDVEGFGRSHRTLPHQLTIRDGLYRVVRRALAAAGVPFQRCHHEDRGDSVLVLVPPDFPKAPLVDDLPRELAAAVRAHNATCDEPGQMRVRLAVHAGEVAFDENGVTSTALTTAFRLLDATPLKDALAGSDGLVAMIVSRFMFDEVVAQSAVLDPATFRPVDIAEKEFHDRAWIALPDNPYPPAEAAGRVRDGVPHQLPGPPAQFSGRAAEMAWLSEAVAGHRSGMVVVSALSGPGGIGKTSLVLAWAHRNLGLFPHGQLSVDLRGFSAGSDPVTPSAALDGFLTAMGVEPIAIPADVDAKAGLYRSVTAGRRMLVVLDNAVDAKQVMPLIPGSPTCTVVVTSRHRLTGLVTARGARCLVLDALRDDEARALLVARISDHRVGREAEAVDRLVALCSGYPLALSITAGRAVTDPRLRLSALAEELRSARLDTLDDGDDVASVPAVLSWSYRALDPQQAELLLLLALTPGPDISLTAVSSLAALPLPRTRSLLRALERASLLLSHSPERYWMHDLVYEWARCQAHRELSDDERTTALNRLLEFYSHTAHHAHLVLEPHDAHYDLRPVSPGCQLLRFSSHAEALAWFTAEHRCLLLMHMTVTTRPWDCLQLAWGLTAYHSLRGLLADDFWTWLRMESIASYDRGTGIFVDRHLANVMLRMGRYEEAIDRFQKALTRAEEAGDRDSQGRIHRGLSVVAEHLGRNDWALHYATRALELFRAVDEPVMAADTVNTIGWCAALLGRYAVARHFCHTAFPVLREHHPPGAADALDTLGYIAHHMGHHTDALEYFRRAVALYRDLGDAFHVPDTLDRTAHVLVTLGRVPEARTAWAEALTFYRAQYRVQDARRVRRKIERPEAVLLARAWPYRRR